MVITRLVKDILPILDTYLFDINQHYDHFVRNEQIRQINHTYHTKFTNMEKKEKGHISKNVLTDIALIDISKLDLLK